MAFNKRSSSAYYYERVHIFMCLVYAVHENRFEVIYDFHNLTFTMGMFELSTDGVVLRSRPQILFGT